MLSGEKGTWDRRRAWGSGAFRCVRTSPPPWCWAWCALEPRCHRRCACIASWSWQTGLRPYSAHSGSWWKGLDEGGGTAEGKKELVELDVWLDYFSFGDCAIIEKLVDSILNIPFRSIKVRDCLFLGGFCSRDEVLEELLLLPVQRLFLLRELVSTISTIWAIISIWVSFYWVLTPLILVISYLETRRIYQ